jgi:hypothetical protein
MAVAAALLIFPNVSQAQSASLKFDVPFEFHVGDKVMPAGSYTVKNIGEAVRISDGAGHTASIMTNPVSYSAAGLTNQLVFNHYGSERFLSEIRWQGYKTSRGVIKSKAEMALAKATKADRLNVATR